jgi:excinuclease ABC subunit A
MQFLSDVFIRCPECSGRRYREHILEVKLGAILKCGDLSPLSCAGDSSPLPARRVAQPKGAVEWSIADLLDATVDEVIGFLNAFADSRPAQRASEKLELLQEVGLGYLKVGQPINTLSGGESQRLKLVSHLAESVAAVCDRRTLASAPNGGGHRPPLPQNATLFLFDEPTTGLHFDDVRVLLQVFQRLVNAGQSVVIIEHNLDVIKCADWVIDLGPEAGDAGGRLVVCGTPEKVAECPTSHTGQALREVLGRHAASERNGRLMASPAAATIG